MVDNLTEDEIYLFIKSDFEGAWNSLAANPDSHIGRGNFMFARQSMNLLEFAARLCANDSSGNSLTDLSIELKKIEPKYFTTLPSSCALTSGFTLPHDGNTTGNLLLWALFDLIRHGLSHQYQQILVNLNDGKKLYVELTGAVHGRDLKTATSSPRPPKHLGYTFDTDGDLGIKVFPEILFLDFQSAIDNSNLLNRGLSFRHLTRPLSTGSVAHYSFGASALENSLIAGTHTKY